MSATTRHRTLVLLAVAVLSACSTGGAAPIPSATVTTVERRHGDAALVVEVVETDAGAAATMAVVHGDGRESLIFEEVRIGHDHWVHAAGAEGALFERAAWIHFDLTEPAHARFLRAHPVGLLEQAELFHADVGADVGDGVVESVVTVSPTERVLHLSTGLAVTVRRARTPATPEVTVPRSLPIVPFGEVESLVGSRG